MVLIILLLCSAPQVGWGTSSYLGPQGEKALVELQDWFSPSEPQGYMLLDTHLAGALTFSEV